MRTRTDLCFPVLGCSLTATDAPEALARWLRRYWQFPDGSTGSNPYRIELHVIEPGHVLTPPSSALPCSAGLPGAVVTCSNLERTWWLEDADGGVRLEVMEESARLDVWQHPKSAAAGGIPYAPLMLALAETVRASGMLPLHAAVAVRGGEATALLARSRTGKSTTLLRMVRSGWSPLAEDFAWFDPATGRVHGWDRRLHLWPGTVEAHLPELAHLDWALGLDGKLFLDLDRLPAPTVGVAQLERIVVLERDPSGPSRWEPVPRAEAVRALWEGFGLPLAKEARVRAAERIAELMMRTKVLRLVLGDTEPEF